MQLCTGSVDGRHVKQDVRGAELPRRRSRLISLVGH